MALSANDQRLLKIVLELGHKLESLWSYSAQESDELKENLAHLKQAISNLESAESFDLKRLAAHEKNLTSDMSARHLAAILVPFERLNSRALRDDEFLVSTDDLSEMKADLGPLTVIAHNIRSAFNVGAILRTSECFGVERVLLTGYTPTPDDEKTAKTSMGANAFVHWEAKPKVLSEIESLKKQGYQIIALETAENAETLGASHDSFRWPKNSALLLGNERFGLERDLLEKADRILRIPLRGRKNSLNVGIAFGIAAANWRDQFEQTKASENAAALEGANQVNEIGVFHSSSRYPYEARRQASIDASGEVGVVELKPGHQFEQALEDLNGFDRIWLLYRFHQNQNWKPKVIPPRGERVKRGVFATRSPYRPNPIGLSCVELVGVEGLKVYVRGFDLLDQTPIYDIKPYLPYADSFPDAKTGWLEKINQDAFSVSLTSLASEQIFWLSENGVSQIRGFILSQLEFNPLDDKRKRVSSDPASSGHYILAYRTWRIRFAYSESARSIQIQNVSSGYSIDDFASSEDPYGDKSIHRKFSEAFDLK